MENDGEILMRIAPSPVRTAFGAFAMGVLAVLLIWVAVFAPPDALGWRVFLVLVGGLSAWNAYDTWIGRRREIVLTESELRDGDGAVLCRIADVHKVDRSVFAFKPARGFLLVLLYPMERAWVPGLWWRIGRRVGVGGTTGGGETRLMAEMIEAMVAARAA